MREIKKEWTTYRDLSIKNLQTKNIISNKYLSLRAQVAYNVSVTTLLILAFPYGNRKLYGNKL